MEKKYFFIAIVFFILSLILLLVQGGYNYNFSGFKKREIIVEKILYEQFAYEVYSSIKSPLSDYEVKESCSNDEEPVDFYIHLDTYFDCRGIFNKDLGKKCQDKIINNYTLCPDSENIDFNKFDYSFDSDKRKLCKYYSKFTEKITKIKDRYICRKKTYNYEALLPSSVSSDNPKCLDGYKKCGILDTKNNFLCWDITKPCPKNTFINKSLSMSDNNYLEFKENTESEILPISFIISENQPLNHEWDILIKENYKKLKTEDINKRREITGEDFRLLDLDIDESYVRSGITIQVKDIPDFIKKDKQYNENQKLNIYTRKYIGFKKYEELKKFKKIFNDKDLKDNPLYKLSSSIHNPLVTIICSAFFLIVAIIYFIILIKNTELISNIPYYISIIIIILFFLCGIIIIGSHFRKYHIININMDSRMEKVLKMYNHRIIYSQLYRIISLFLNMISIIFIFISFCKKENQYQEMPN